MKHIAYKWHKFSYWLTCLKYYGPILIVALMKISAGVLVISTVINKHILGPPLERPISEAYSKQMAQILLLAHILKYYRGQSL